MDGRHEAYTRRLSNFYESGTSHDNRMALFGEIILKVDYLTGSRRMSSGNAASRMSTELFHQTDDTEITVQCGTRRGSKFVSAAGGGKGLSLQSASRADPHIVGRCKCCWWVAFPTRPQHVQAARSTSVGSRQVSVDILKSFVILSRTTDSCDTGRSRTTVPTAKSRSRKERQEIATGRSSHRTL